MRTPPSARTRGAIHLGDGVEEDDDERALAEGEVGLVVVQHFQVVNAVDHGIAVQQRVADQCAASGVEAAVLGRHVTPPA